MLPGLLKRRSPASTGPSLPAAHPGLVDTRGPHTPQATPNEKAAHQLGSLSQCLPFGVGWGSNVWISHTC